MVQQTVGREVVCGTICRDRFRAAVTIVCSDRIPAGQASQLALSIRWRKERDGSGPPEMPDDAKPITLTFRKRTAAATGDIRFDGAGGPNVKGFTADALELLTIHGESASSGAQPDVLLDVKIEGEVRASIPLSVGSVPVAVAIKAANGTDPPPTSLVPGAPVTLKAVTTPATAGSFQWVSLDASALRINGASNTDTVAVEALGQAPQARLLCVLFRPQGGGAQVMAAHLFPAGVRFAGQIEDRSVAPHFAVASTGHRFLPAGTAFEILDQANNVVLNGTTTADGRFDVSLVPGQTYKLRVPGFEGLGP